MTIKFRATCDVPSNSKPCGKPAIGVGAPGNGVPYLLTLVVGKNRYQVCEDHARLSSLRDLLIEMGQGNAEVGVYEETSPEKYP
jgi:hypothetical protein